MKKRFLSLVLVMALLLSLVPVFAAPQARAATSATVYFKNTDGWGSVYGYAWDAAGNPILGTWPGTPLSPNGNGLYELTVSCSGGLNFIFNSGSGAQTGDLYLSESALTSDSWWVNGGSGTPQRFAPPTAVNGKVTFTFNGSASKVLLAGSMNGWSGVAMTKSGSTFTYTCELAPGKYEYKFVADGTWINDPRNPQTTGSDNNNFIIVPGMTATSVSVVKGTACALPAELSYVDANGDSTLCAVTYSSSSSYATLSGNTVTVSNSYTGSTLDLTATNAQGETCTVTLNIVTGTTSATNVKLHFINSTGWSGVAAHTWITQGTTSTGLTTWPGVTVDRDADGFFTLELNQIFTAGQGLGVLFHNNNGAQTADITISASDIAKGSVERWIQPSITADDTGKHPVTVTSTHSAQFISVERSGNQVTFRYKGSGSSVYLAGSFNSWSTSANKMTKSGGVFSTTVTLSPGVYEYKFVVDGEWITDPYNALVGGYDSNSVAVIGDGNAPSDNGKVKVVLHFYRSSGSYTGWENDISPNQGMNYTDAIIYEMHVREMTIDSSSGVKDAWKGKYLGLTQSGTNYQGRATGLDHLKELGITHVQLMPVFDFNSADEYHLTDWQQYAWGYDPKNYNTPEGSYATDPFDGAVRITEFKTMVQTLHANGINVVMDVVYNHAFDGGNFCYNKIVPNYFSRFYGEGNWSNGSGVGNDIATERSMARNFIVDSVMHWVEEYHIDGFRFDLAGLIDTQTINEIVNTVHAKYPNVIFYGEGWGVGGTAVEEGYALATKDNAWQTPGFAFFNDNFRNDIAGDNGHSWGFATGDWGKADALGNYFRASNGWSTTPTQTINYVSCHDNYSLMDKIIISRDGASWDEMVRMNNLSAATYLLAQGVPMIYSGEELLREKKDASGNRYDNAYGTDDYINKIRWSDLVDKTYTQVADDYYAGLVAFRKNHAALRCPGGADAWNYTSYHKINDQCVLFYINGYPNYECSEGIVVIYNASNTTQWVNLYDYGVPSGNWQACIHGDKAGTSALWSTSDGSVGVEGISATVLVLGDLIHEESVYNSQKTSCAHTSHNTNGICTGCGRAVEHSFVGGVCSCGLKEDIPEDMTVYFENTGGWSKVNIYAWTTGTATTEYAGVWPGSAMTHVSGNIYSFTLSGAAVNVIFNNGTAQTDDLTLPSVDSGKNLYSNGVWTTYTPECAHSWTAATCTAPKTCTLCGETEGSALGHSYVSGTCSVCGAKDPDYVAVVIPTLTVKKPTLAFEDEILYNVYYIADDLTSVVEMGMVTFATRDANGTVATAQEVIPGYVQNTDGTYTVHSNGIPAKMLSDALYFKVYAKLSDGTYAYSGVYGYHAVAYANTILNSSASSAKAKSLVVAMLNYGAAAQTNFSYKTDALMNANLTADQQALVDDYSESMVAAVPTVSTTKAGAFVMNGGYSDIHPTVSFEGAFSINYYFTPKYVPNNGSVTFYYWNLSDFNSVGVLTTGNATGSVKMTSDTGVYTTAIEGIAAKAIDEPVYVAAVYSNAGTSYYTPVIGYSLGAYCKNLAANGNAFGAATAVYGYYAKAYFA